MGFTGMDAVRGTSNDALMHAFILAGCEVAGEGAKCCAPATRLACPWDLARVDVDLS